MFQTITCNFFPPIMSWLILAEKWVFAYTWQSLSLQLSKNNTLQTWQLLKLWNKVHNFEKDWVGLLVINSLTHVMCLISTDHTSEKNLVQKNVLHMHIHAMNLKVEGPENIVTKDMIRALTNEENCSIFLLSRMAIKVLFWCQYCQTFWISSLKIWDISLWKRSRMPPIISISTL